MSKGNQSGTSKVKRGAVIDRRRNRTVDQSRAASEPKWKHIGHGVLEFIGANGTQRNRIRPVGRGRYESVSNSGYQISDIPNVVTESVSSNA